MFAVRMFININVTKSSRTVLRLAEVIWNRIILDAGKQERMKQSGIVSQSILLTNRSKQNCSVPIQNLMN